MANIKFVLTERDAIENLVEENHEINLSNPEEVSGAVKELAASMSRYSAVTIAEATKAAAKAERIASKAK